MKPNTPPIGLQVVCSDSFSLPPSGVYSRDMPSLSFHAPAEGNLWAAHVGAESNPKANVVDACLPPERVAEKGEPRNPKAEAQQNNPAAKGNPAHPPSAILPTVARSICSLFGGGSKPSSSTAAQQRANEFHRSLVRFGVPLNF
ncbi:MAG: hypothetical protein A3E83_06330 [Gammaproteobacteria bacterium RIFCSPHIGHO2_12_FULL_41_20]|nr:MAG: hypothetical protein A3E83_06330 [Gammaproteobacteria bacterium RIFCSPHIGHO2_12_FULL_41_20]